MSRTGRRDALVSFVALALAACQPPEPSQPVKPMLPPLKTERLEDLATGAGLVWMVRARPRDVAATPFLIPAIGRIVPEQNFDKFKGRVGLDPRQVTEVLLLRYGPALSDAEAQIARHGEPVAELERRFFARLSDDPTRREDRPDVVRIDGIIGRSPHVFSRIGKDVVVFQQGGDVARGPARIAGLYAMGKLAKARPLLADEPLKSLIARFGSAPVVAASVGPFSDEWKKAARGLLEVSTGVAAAARPTARENVGLALAIAGEFGAEANKASELLLASWDDVALSTMGHLLGLDKPVEKPVVAADKGVVALHVEVEPNRLAEGLRALAEHDLEAIMKLD